MFAVMITKLVSSGIASSQSINWFGEKIRNEEKGSKKNSDREF